WRTVGRPVVRAGREGASVSAQELENYESDLELQLFREYRDVVSLFTYVIETERRFYLANQVDLQVRSGEARSSTNCGSRTSGCGTSTARTASCAPCAW